MAKPINVKYGALNITIHPHDKNGDVYVEMLNYLARKPIHVRAQDYVYMYGLKPINENNISNGLQGTFVKCTKIELDKFFDTEIDDYTEIKEIAEAIPEGTFANARSFDFIFFPKKHLLVTEVKDNREAVSIHILAKFFENAFKYKDVIAKFENLHVHVLPDPDQVEQLIKREKIIAIELKITRPNPDDVDSVEKRLQAKMKKMKVEKIEERYVSSRKEFIEPDEETKNKMRAAARNGMVEIKAIDDYGLTKKFSTEDIPFVANDKYDPDTSSQKDILIRKALEIFTKFNPFTGKLDDK